MRKVADPGHQSIVLGGVKPRDPAAERMPEALKVRAQLVGGVRIVGEETGGPIEKISLSCGQAILFGACHRVATDE